MKKIMSPVPGSHWNLNRRRYYWKFLSNHKNHKISVETSNFSVEKSGIFCICHVLDSSVPYRTNSVFTKCFWRWKSQTFLAKSWSHTCYHYARLNALTNYIWKIVIKLLSNWFAKIKKNQVFNKICWHRRVLSSSNLWHTLL